MNQYSLYPHGGNWRDALNGSAGVRTQLSAAVRQIEKHEGELKDDFSFMQIQATTWS